MKIDIILSGGTKCPIIVKAETEERLRRTCFRDTLEPLAGKFIYWQTVHQVLTDNEVAELFTQELSEVWTEHDFGTIGSTLQLSRNIGWESTDALANYTEDELEIFKPNRRSIALRVKPSCKNRLAPLTCEVTIIYRFALIDDKPKVFIYSMYPGCDIGELNDDVTAREGRVFFDWNHPGE